MTILFAAHTAFCIVLSILFTAFTTLCMCIIHCALTHAPLIQRDDDWSHYTRIMMQRHNSSVTGAIVCIAIMILTVIAIICSCHNG